MDVLFSTPMNLSDLRASYRTSLPASLLWIEFSTLVFVISGFSTSDRQYSHSPKLSDSLSLSFSITHTQTNKCVSIFTILVCLLEESPTGKQYWTDDSTVVILSHLITHASLIQNNNPQYLMKINPADKYLYSFFCFFF